jgi:hypothetical protein
MINQTHELNLPHAERTYRVLDEVAAERARQHNLLAAGSIPFDCADPAVDLHVKLPVLIEEIGEVAALLQTIAVSRMTEPDEPRMLMLTAIREELLQVAAVAVAMAESLTPTATAWSELHQPHRRISDSR